MASTSQGKKEREGMGKPKFQKQGIGPYRGGFNGKQIKLEKKKFGCRVREKDKRRGKRSRRDESVERGSRGKLRGC